MRAVARCHGPARSAGFDAPRSHGSRRRATAIAPEAHRPAATGTATLDRPPANGLSTATRSGRSGRRIGEVVVDLGFADRQAVEQAVSAARSQRKPTGQVLVEQGVLRQDQLARVVAERFGLDYVDLSVYEPDMGAVNLLSAEAIKRYQAVPVSFTDDGALLLAMADPTNILSIDDIAMITNRRVRVAAASAEDVNLLATRLGRLEGAIEDIVEDDERESLETALSEEADQDAPIIKLVHSIIAQAVQQGASDIHVNPEEGDTQVLFRVDGVLYPAATVRRRMAAGMVSRIKIMADLDISERRAPQDGRLALNVEGRRIDIRVVTLPLVHGEGAVMRILDKGVVVQNLESLGMRRRRAGALRPRDPPAPRRRARHRADRLGQVDHAVRRRSPSSTTAPARSSRSRIPSSRGIAGVKQMQVAPKAGVTFDTGLRSMLRADPDVIMVGEIRDRETAHIAIEAALTGHLVLSTLHTRDAPSALGRLTDMGIEPFLVSSAIDCIVAQRLVRMLCPHCKRPANLPETVLREYGLAGHPALRARRLLALLGLRLPRARRHLRGHAHHRRDPHPDPPARLRRRHRRHRRPRGHAPPARRRHREGARRAHLDRGGRAHDHQPRVGGGQRVGGPADGPGPGGPQLVGYSSEIRSGPDGNASASNEYAS